MSGEHSPHTTPWYRQVWPWILIAIPVAGVIMATITTIVALRTADVDVRTEERPPLDKTSWQSGETAP